ncbi:DNA ligase 4-like isoform X1 [Neodiprion virginianus]|uniref:DNA ligase 4-like isoform X1 n=2 Tax=Neodiprion virginianus TaxID=2961670 RepID=UPI001EE77B69|nr:DNA ligase 4-like isoform X1 [Neodiprion virginianus]
MCMTMTLTFASKVKFIEFCMILDKISKAQAATKSSHLECLIKQCREFSEKLKKKDKEADTSFFPILRLLLPQHDREREAYGLKETALAKLYVRVLALGQTSKDAQELLHYKVPISGKQSGGDFAEIAYSILCKRVQIQESSMTVEQVNTILDNIAEKNASNSSKDGEFQQLIQQLSAVEQKWLIRILLKDLRIGLSQKKILNAYHADAVALFDVSMSLRVVCDKLQNAGIGTKYQIEIFSPFKPMLLERYKIDDIGKFFTNQESYLVETKHDGERFQLHMKDGQFSYFSRNAYNFTEAYGKSKSSGLLTGKIAKLLKPSCRSIIMDGEMMGWHKVQQRFGSKGMSFDVKKMTPTSTHQPCFIAFDVIMYNEKLLVDEPLTERLKVLKEAFVEETGVLVRSQTRLVSSKVELLDAFNESMDTFEEGIVLKKCNSTYKPGVRMGSDCYKIKAEYSADLVEDMDLVIVGGYYGEGKMRGRINSFLVAVAHSQNPETMNDLKFHTVSSVRTGIKIEAFEELLLTLEPHWVKKCPDNVVGPKKDPPNLWIEPKNSIVLKLRATELVQSSSYPTGYSLRFPRVVAIRGRDEKSWCECCTTEEFHSLVKGPGVIQKLTKRHVTEHDVMEHLPAISPRKTKNKTITVLNYNPCPTTAVSRISRLLDDKEICVVNGNDEISKEDVEKIVREHGGSIVQNPGGKTFCAIVGNANKLKVKNMIQGQKYNVVNLEWLLRATRPENFASLQPWLPWELLFATESTRSHMSTVFDDTYDSYTQDTNIDDLKRSLERAAELAKDSQLTNNQYKEIDRELFGHETSPFSVFRGSVGYFCTSDKQRNLEFRFMGGTVTGILDNHVTHIFALKNSNIPAEIRRLEAGESATKVLDEQWIADCFRERKLLPEDEYSIHQNTTNSC